MFSGRLVEYSFFFLNIRKICKVIPSISQKL